MVSDEGVARWCVMRVWPDEVVACEVIWSTYRAWLL